MTFSVESSSALDTGRARRNNEDAVLLDPDLSLFVLADGMGGYNAGEVASDMAVRMVRDEVVRQLPVSGASDDASVRRAVTAAANTANSAVYEASQNVPEYAGMGTTLVVMLVGAARLWVGHIGDSRAYRLRGGKLSQITKDHSLLQEQLDAGLITPEEAAYSTQRNLVTRALGVEPEAELELHGHDWLAGDVYLLCSDGLSDMLPDARIEDVMNSKDELSELAQALVDAANAAGGRDNISVVLARVRGEPSPAGRAWWPFTRK